MTDARDKVLEIRPMRLDDLDSILQVEESSFTVPWTRFMFEQEMKNEKLCHYLVAVKQGKIVGYMGFWLVLEEAHITNLAVHPDHRREKIGEQLLLAALQRASSRGATRASLEVRATNHAGIKLYEKHGFKLVALRRGYYEDNQEDALIMWAENIKEYLESVREQTIKQNVQ